MELKRTWDKESIAEFHNYLKEYSKGEEKGVWKKRILNTEYPCIAVPSTKVGEIIREISKGDFISFIENIDITNHTELVIKGNLICKIKDFNVFKKYLDEYLLLVDSWASTDSLKIEYKRFQNEFIKLAKEYIKSKKTYYRRMGVIILLKLLRIGYLREGLELVALLKEEQEYYVNMAVAWYLCDCFIKDRIETMIFLKNGKVNDFVMNKTISKCRDSYRVSQEDKDNLLALKRPTKKEEKPQVKNKTNANQKFKDSYFNYYDDIKSHTHRIYDW